MNITKAPLALAMLASLALAGCITSFGGNCTRDPVTGRVVCQGEYTPAPVPEPETVQGERG